MVQRKATMISLLVLVGIVVVAGAMYAVIGSRGGFDGVPRVFSGDFAKGATGNLLYTIVWALMIAGLFALLGVAVYKLRGLQD